ncbi:MAG: DsrE family protein [bacterium]|nr:DsrE family protein [bacterium]
MNTNVILVAHRHLGTADEVTAKLLQSSADELGEKLYLNFWRTLAEGTHRPRSICFLHQAVKSLLPDSPVLDALKILANDGVSIYACRTCCDYYKITEQVVIGKIVSMGDIQQELFTGSVLSL